MTHASESGHWYDREGNPVYEVTGAKGQKVKPDIRHARKLNLFPGITTIIRQAAVPSLERWKIEQAILAALTLPRIDGESNDALLARIRQDAEEHAKQARDRGTEIHAAIQGHFEGEAPYEEMWPYVEGVVEHIKANCAQQSWVAEKPVVHEMGFGTKSDLHCAHYVLDFKGSEFSPEEAASLKTWDEHAMQLAATRNALDLPKAECGIVYVSRSHPGACRLVWLDEDDLYRGWSMFCGLHSYWCAKNSYWPAAVKEAA